VSPPGARGAAAVRRDPRLLRLLGAVAVVAVVAFAPVVTYGFAYDDHWTVEHDPALDGRLAPLLKWLFAGQGVRRGIPDATRPGMVASLWLDRHVFGAEPAGYHLHSLCLYGLCSALAALAVFSITRRVAAALVGGLVFAAAPVHAEVVAAVNYREDLIAGVAVFGVVAWLFAPRQTREPIDRAVLTAALLLCGLLSKESVVAVVPMVLAATLARTDLRAWFAARRAPIACLLAAAAIWGVWRGWLRLAGRDDVPLALVHRGAAERILRTARYTVRVTLDGLFPIGWSPEYANEPVASGWWLLAAAALIAAIYGLSRLPRGRPLAAGLAIAMVAGLPTSPLVSPINERADRFVFLATLGGALFWGTLGARVARRIPRRLRFAVLALALVPLGVLARRAAAPWRSDAALWATAIERAPTSARAWTGLSRTLRLSGDLDGADRAIERAIVLEPGSLRARVTRVYNRLARGDTVGARAEIEDIRRRGGGRQLGMRRAAQCAERPAIEAARCAKM
jgi:hypothetical protein